MLPETGFSLKIRTNRHKSVTHKPYAFFYTGSYFLWLRPSVDRTHLKKWNVKVDLSSGTEYKEAKLIAFERANAGISSLKRDHLFIEIRGKEGDIIRLEGTFFGAGYRVTGVLNNTGSYQHFQSDKVANGKWRSSLLNVSPFRAYLVPGLNGAKTTTITFMVTEKKVATEKKQ